MEELEVISDDDKIGDALVKMKIMTKEQVNIVLEKQNKGDNRLFGEIAIETGFIDDAALQKYLQLKK